MWVQRDGICATAAATAVTGAVHSSITGGSKTAAGYMQRHHISRNGRCCLYIGVCSPRRIDMSCVRANIRAISGDAGDQGANRRSHNGCSFRSFRYILQHYSTSPRAKFLMRREESFETYQRKPARQRTLHQSMRGNDRACRRPEKRSQSPTLAFGQQRAGQKNGTGSETGAGASTCSSRIMLSSANRRLCAPFLLPCPIAFTYIRDPD